MRKYIYILTLLLVCSACSDEQDNKEIKEKEELSIHADIAVSVATGAQIRADGETSFIKDFDLYVKQTAPASEKDDNYIEHNAKYETNSFAVFTQDVTPQKWYWDDNAGVDAVIDLIGIYPKSTITNVGTQFDWEIKKDQSIKDLQTTPEDYIASDLLVTERVLGYSLSTQKGGVADLKFHHTLSKFTFILVAGDGFKEDYSDFTPSLTTSELKTKANIIIADDGTVTVKPDEDNVATEITPYLVKDSSTGGTKTFAAIVIPGQEINKGDVFANVVIKINGGENEYSIKLPELKANISSDPNKLKLEKEKNYLFTIKINKTDTDVSASIIDWTKVDEIKQEVTISVDESKGALDNKDIMNGASLHIKVVKNNNEVTGLRTKSIFSKPSSEVAGNWSSLTPILYWDDIPTGSTTFANAFLFNTTTTNVEEIYIGKTESLEFPVKSLNFKDMYHPFSRLTIKVRTEKEQKYSVDLDNLTRIKLHSNLQRFDKINLVGTTEYPEINYKTNSLSHIEVSELSSKIETETDKEGNKKEYKYRDIIIYIKPTSVTGTLLDILYKKGDVENTYPFVKDIIFQENKKYEITVTLSKTEIAQISVSIDVWKDGESIDGGATIKD